jgi:hypothetical protein
VIRVAYRLMSITSYSARRHHPYSFRHHHIHLRFQHPSTMTDPTATRYAEWCWHDISIRRQLVERESFESSVSLCLPIQPLSPQQFFSLHAFEPPLCVSSPHYILPSRLILCSLHCRIPFLRCTRIINNNRSNSNSGILPTLDLSLPPIHR